MKLSEMFPTNLLKSQDVTDAGGEMPLEIKNVEMREFDGDDGSKETKPVLFFTNGKQMVLNKTNGTTLAKMFGDDTDGWVHKEITLIVAEVPFGGKTVPAIRIHDADSREMQVQAFWKKARELGLTRQDGLDHLALYHQDFAKALAGLEAPK